MVLNMETYLHTRTRFNQNANAASPAEVRRLRERHRAACLAISYLSSSYSPWGSLIKSLGGSPGVSGYRAWYILAASRRETTIIIKDSRWTETCAYVPSLPRREQFSSCSSTTGLRTFSLSLSLSLSLPLCLSSFLSLFSVAYRPIRKLKFPTRFVFKRLV